MTADQPTPSPRDTRRDALARLLWTPVQTDVGPRSMYFDECADAILDSTDPAVHAARAHDLPPEVLWAELERQGRVDHESEEGIADPGTNRVRLIHYTRRIEAEWREVEP